MLQFYSHRCFSRADKKIHFHYGLYLVIFHPHFSFSLFNQTQKIIIMVHEVVFAPRKWKVDDNSFRTLAEELETLCCLRTSGKAEKKKRRKNKTTRNKKRSWKEKYFHRRYVVRKKANDFQIYERSFPLRGHYSWGWKSWKCF